MEQNEDSFYPVVISGPAYIKDNAVVITGPGEIEVSYLKDKTVILIGSNNILETEIIHKIQKDIPDIVILKCTNHLIIDDPKPNPVPFLIKPYDAHIYNPQPIKPNRQQRRKKLNRRNLF